MNRQEAERILLAAAGGVRPKVGESLQFTGEGFRFDLPGGGQANIEIRADDPDSPESGDLWIRSDFSPPAFRFFNGTSVQTIGPHVDAISEDAPPANWEPEGGVGALWLQTEGG
jgi:hypothetical protein